MTHTPTGPDRSNTGLQDRIVRMTGLADPCRLRCEWITHRLCTVQTRQLFELRPQGGAKDLLTRGCIRKHSRVLGCTVSEMCSTKQRGGNDRDTRSFRRATRIWAGNKDIAFYSQTRISSLRARSRLSLLLQCLDDSRTLKSKRKNVVGKPCRDYL